MKWRRRGIGTSSRKRSSRRPRWDSRINRRFRRFKTDTWDERPRGLASGLSFGLGWIMIVIWVVATTGFCLWQLATGPEDLLAKLLVFSGLSAIGRRPRRAERPLPVLFAYYSPAGVPGAEDTIERMLFTT